MIRSEIEAKLLEELRLLSPEQLADILNYTRSLNHCIEPIKQISQQTSGSTTLNLAKLALFRSQQPLTQTSSLQHLQALRQEARY